MTESDLLDKVCDILSDEHNTDIPRPVLQTIVRVLSSEITECVAHGDAVAVTNFGSFRSKDYDPRKVENPSGVFEIPARRLPRFVPSSTFRQRCKTVAESLNHL